MSASHEIATPARAVAQKGIPAAEAAKKPDTRALPQTKETLYFKKAIWRRRQAGLSMGQQKEKQGNIPAHEVTMEVTMPFYVREQMKALAALEGKSSQKLAESIIVKHVQQNEHKLDEAFALKSQEGFKRPYRTPLQKLLERNKELEQENARLHKSAHR